MGLDLKAKVSLDGSGFQAGLSGLDKAVGGFARNLAAAFSVGAVANFAKSVIDWGSQINDVSVRLGVSAMRAQELSFAAKQSGADINDIATGLTRLQDAYETMRNGGPAGEKIFNAFKTLGVGIDELATLKPDQLLDRIALSIEQTGATSEKTAAMLDLFGRSGGKLIAVLAELNQKTQEFKDAGLGISEEDIKLLDKAGDKLDKLLLKAKTIGAKAIVDPESFLPFASFTGLHMLNFSEWFQKKFGQAIDFGKLPFDKTKPNTTPDYTGLPPSVPKYLGDDEEERNVEDYNKARTVVLRRMMAAPQGDSLSAIGNFLGARGGLQTIAERQLNIQTMVLDELRNIRGVLSKPQATDISVPPPI